MNQRKTGRLSVCLILIALAAAFFAPTASANSMPPPTLTVFVNAPLPDLTLSLQFADGCAAAAFPLQRARDRPEAYYRFLYWAVDSTTDRTRLTVEGAVLVVRSDEYNFECPLPASMFNLYSSQITLDLVNESFAMGPPPFPSPASSPAHHPLLIALRVMLTLLIEGLILLAFGYRRKASWIAFFTVNLITQGALNVLLSGPAASPSYWVWFERFVFYETLIFVVEAITFSFLLAENTKRKAVVYALTANAASLVLGGLLLSFLPI